MENYQENQIPFQLILDEMERKLSPDEINELERWKAASPQNLVIYDDLKNAEGRLEILSLYQRTDVDQAWNKISTQLQQKKKIPVIGKRKFVIMIGSIAAAAILAGVFFTFSWIFPPKQTFYRTAKNEHRQIVLPDGSEVFLNENSSLSYAKTGFQKKRYVKLIEGEAYFEVVHNESSEFLVQMDEVQVRDIGTSFILKINADKIDVIVSSGSVSMESLQPSNSKKVLLNANQRAIFDRTTKEISKTMVIPANFKAWQDKKLRYIQTPLEDVFTDLNRIYGTNVIFLDTTLKDRKLSAFFDQKTEDQIMQIIAASLRLKIAKKDSTFVVSQ